MRTAFSSEPPYRLLPNQIGYALETKPFRITYIVIDDEISIFGKKRFQSNQKGWQIDSDILYASKQDAFDILLDLYNATKEDTYRPCLQWLALFQNYKSGWKVSIGNSLFS